VLAVLTLWFDNTPQAEIVATQGPQFKTDERGEGPGDWATYQLRRVFQELQMASHANEA